jgi:hypothetical protein
MRQNGVYLWKRGEVAEALGLTENEYGRAMTDFGIAEAREGRNAAYWIDADGTETVTAEMWWRLARYVDTTASRRYACWVDADPSAPPYLRLLPPPTNTDGGDEEGSDHETA